MATITLFTTLFSTNVVYASSVEDDSEIDSCGNISVTIMAHENGTINFFNSQDSTLMMQSGETCKFTTKPDEGFAVDEVCVKDSTEQELEVTEEEENTYSFVVENSNVQINVTFLEEENTENVTEDTELQTESTETETESLETESEQESTEDVQNALDIVNNSLLASDLITPLADNGFLYEGSVTYSGHTVGKFSVNGVRAFCMEHSKPSTPSGTAFNDSIISNGDIAKVLYYGWSGIEQWEGFKSEEQGIVVTTLAISHYYSNDPEDVTGESAQKSGLADFISFIGQQSIPPAYVNFSPSSVDAYLTEDGKAQRTDDITFEADSRNTITITLQDGVYLYNNSTGVQSTGTATIFGGQSFYLVGDLKVNDTWETGTLGGTIKQYNAIMASVDATYQSTGRIEVSIDPVPTTSLTVNWLSTGSLKLTKKNTDNELVDGAKFRIQSATDGITYDETVTVTNGTITVDGLLAGDYIVKEVSTPKNNGKYTGYLLDANNEEDITIEAGQTTSLTVKNHEPTGTINLTKEDSETGSKAQGLATLKGATYQLYAKDDIVNANGTTIYKAGKKVGDEKSTNSDGEITWTKLPMGKYYVKEVSASTGYTLDKTEYEVTLEYKNKTTEVITKNLTVNETVAKGKIQICKYDEKTKEIVTANKATFGIYAGSTMNIDGKTYDKGDLIESVSTKDGVATSSYLPYGNYFVKESAAPTKYLINTEKSDILKITTNKEVVSYDITDEPVTGEITITKEDSETGNDAQGLATLQKAQYGLYAKADIVDPSDGSVLYEKDDLISKKTVNKGKWGDTGLKSTDENGQISWSNLPLGKYYVKEVKASTGYNLDETEYNVTLTYKDNKTAVITNETTVKEKVIKGKFQIYKYDEKTGKVVTANSATFNIYATVDMNIGGKIYKADDLIETITTVKGIATSSNLPYGKYYIKEKSSPIKYTIDTTVSDTFTIKYENQVISYNVYNAPVTGEITITKEDSETKTAQGNATLKDAQYGLYAKEDILDPSDGSVLFKQGTLISEKTVNRGTWGDTGIKSTDENGNITWSNLPLGEYFVKEVKASTGYNLNKTEYPVTLTYKDNSTSIIIGTKTVAEDIIRGDIELSKFGRDSNDTESTEMNPLAGVIFSITSNTTGETWYIETNENGYADTVANSVYSKIITDSDGNITVDENSIVARNSRGFFVYDSYTIKELNTPKGYQAIHDITFQLKQQSYKYQWILEDKDVVSAIQIVKVDSETGNTIPLAGTTFKIYDENMNQLEMVVSRYPSLQMASEFTTDETGSFTFPQKLQAGTYYLEEVSAPEGYLIGGLYKFTVEEGRDWSNPYVVEYADDNVMGQITIKKSDSLDGSVLKNATYGIYASEDIITNDNTLRYSAGDLVDTVTTDEKGYAVSKKLYLGKYYVKELSAPDGYKLDSKSYDVTLKWQDGVTPVVYVSVELKDEPNTIYIEKVCSETGKSLSGAVLQLLDKDGTIVDEWTTDGKAHEISKLTAGTYTLHEVSAPDGYNLSNDMEVEVKEGISSNVIKMTDVPIKIAIDKVNANDTTTSLQGAVLQLLDEDGNVKYEWTTDGKAHEISAIPVGTYTLHEVSAPEGYNLADDVEVKVIQTEKVQTFVMEDIPTKISVDKVDADDITTSLQGAVLQLLDENGNVKYEWTTDGKAHEISAIPVGTYTLHEVSAPDGYALASDMEIEIKQTEELQKFSMKDAKIQLTIEKVDAFDEELSLTGATYQLVTMDEDVVDEWVTVENKPHELSNIPTGNYIVRELSAPDGYTLAEDVEIEIKDTDEVQKFVVGDIPIRAEVAKVDYSSGKMIDGATLQILDGNGNVLDEWVSSSQEAHPLYAIEAGTYTLHEVSAPEGYALADDMEIQIKRTEEVQTFTMKDKYIGGIRTSISGRTNSNGGLTVSTKRHVPQTGDSTNIVTYVGLIISALMLIVATIFANHLHNGSPKGKKRTIKKRKSMFSFLLLVFCLTVPTTSQLYAKGANLIREEEFTTDSKENLNWDFEKSYEENNRTYTLEDVTYEIIDEIPIKTTETVEKTIESDLLLTTEDYIPEETIIEDGVTYTLEDCSVLDGSNIQKTYSTYTDYLDGTTIPTTQKIGVTDENGQNVSINGTLVNTQTVSDGEWVDSTIQITFDHYDTGVFNWQGETIYNNSDLPLAGHYNELLESVGADANTYRITSTAWSGDAYEVDGIVYRDAVANVQQFVNYVRATYSGTLDYVQYECSYKGEQDVISNTNYNYIVKASAIYEMDNTLTLPQVLVFTGIGIAILAVFVILVLRVISKKKKQEDAEESISLPQNVF